MKRYKKDNYINYICLIYFMHALYIVYNLCVAMKYGLYLYFSHTEKFKLHTNKSKFKIEKCLHSKFGKPQIMNNL